MRFAAGAFRKLEMLIDPKSPINLLTLKDVYDKGSVVKSAFDRQQEENLRQIAGHRTVTDLRLKGMTEKGANAVVFQGDHSKLSDSDRTSLKSVFRTELEKVKQERG